MIAPVTFCEEDITTLKLHFVNDSGKLLLKVVLSFFFCQALYSEHKHLNMT